MHVVDDAAQRKAMLEGMLAWNSDFHYLYIDVAGSGLLPVEAERQGKVVVTTELGGGGLVTRAVHELSERGLANVLRHAGILEGEVETRASLGKPDAVILDGRDPRTYVFAPASGILETLVDVGETVTAGQPVGRIYSLEHPERALETIEAPLDSVVVGIRAISWTEQGDSAFVFGVPIEASALL
jgi:predicted deacylase